MENSLRVGIIAPKNTDAEIAWLASYVEAKVEPYRRGRRYDLLFFFNLTPEIEVIKRHTDAKVFSIAIDSDAVYPINREARYIDLCDYYMGYENFSGAAFCGEFQHLVFPAATAQEIAEQFCRNIESERPYTFAIFAKHDPNIRQAIGDALKNQNSLLAGPLFNRPVADKMACQKQVKYEFITENVINPYYFSEKLPQSLLAGCVPIYYGCEKVKDYVPEDLFLCLSDFAGIPDVIEYCNKPSVYEFYFENIRKRGRQLLLERFTFDQNVFAPLNRYIRRLQAAGFRNSRASLQWRTAYPRKLARTIGGRMWRAVRPAARP